MKATKSTIGRAASAAVLAVLLTACGKSVTVSGGGEAALPTEERLRVFPHKTRPASEVSRPSSRPARPSPVPAETVSVSDFARERARWTPTAAERAGPHRSYTDLIPINQRQIIHPANVAAAAGFRPSFALDDASYTRSPPYTRVRQDYSAFWREYATDTGTTEQKSRVGYWADSGVSQSSRGASGSVHDRVQVDIGAIAPIFGNKLTTRVELRYAGNPDAPGALTHWSIDNTPPANAPFGGTHLLPSWTRWNGPDGSRARQFSQNIPGGAVKLIVRTDRADAADTDWLATGMWWAGSTRAPYASFGVFADGGDHFDHSVFRSLAGTATYTGVAHGIFSHGASDDQRITIFEGVNMLFQADASLTANFGTPSARGRGSVSGSITDLRSGGQDFPGAPTITLGEASLGVPGASTRTTFAGDTSLTYDETTYSGKWGGQFFGNTPGATGADKHPSSAAGTFGVTAGVGSSFLGTFEVHR